jgi:bacterioferritin
MRLQSEMPPHADLRSIRRRAQEHIENGAVVESYAADPQVVVDMLNAALATELVCVMRYKRHYYMAHSRVAAPVADEFLRHANEELGHADELARRITQLNGAPSFDPETLLSRSHSQYGPGGTLIEMIREDLIAERIAIESYAQMIRYLGPRDPTTRRMLEGILACEEQHALEMADLLARHSPQPADPSAPLHAPTRPA